MPYRKSAKPLIIVPRPSLAQVAGKILKASWMTAEAWWMWVMSGEEENGTPFQDYKALYIHVMSGIPFWWPWKVGQNGKP